MDPVDYMGSITACLNNGLQKLPELPDIIQDFNLISNFFIQDTLFPSFGIVSFFSARRFGFPTG